MQVGEEREGSRQIKRNDLITTYTFYWNTLHKVTFVVE